MEHKDTVNHPSHYKSETGMEVIDVIEAFTFDLSGIEATDTGNILKYMCRWKKKNGLEDLKKAKWYLEHLISRVELLENENSAAAQDEFCNPIYGNAEDAQRVKEALVTILNRYGFVTVWDLYELSNITTECTDNKYGWTNLPENLKVIEVRSGYQIYLPNPTKIK